MATTIAVTPPTLDETMVRNLVTDWYRSTNDHLPVEQLVNMLADDMKMTYPNIDEPFTGTPAFKNCYAEVLAKYFNETHRVAVAQRLLVGISSDPSPGRPIKEH
ncbi:hypothetical protein [Mycobacterium sp. E2733]|uniref:hypothetical protein n=1 Tax=Mycobacterium sp. E2733 TaxID=1834138 RepID=UPI0008014A3E|nr:hypothetical protein [Mycobacterium sp. E2733]OBH98700.1 hypothetical protein A5678_21875 [Mycobacterium sp. E2733]